MLTQEREKLYKDLESRVGNTPLVELFGIRIPNGNRIFLKDESNTVKGTKQPLNHYGRVFLPVYRELEENGRLRPGTVVFDTSQGNAALSLTILGRELGFEPYAIIPKGHLPQKMLAYLREAGAQLIETTGDDYVNDFDSAIRDFRNQQMINGKRVVFLNHSMKSGGINKPPVNNETTLKALEPIARETLVQLKAVPDYFVGVWGNGSSMYAVSRVLKEEGTKPVGWELFSQAVAFETAYPGRYSEEFEISPGTLTKIHGIPGSSYWGKAGPIDFPHVRNAVTGSNPAVPDNRLVADSRILEAYAALAQKKDNAEELIGRVGSLPQLDAVMGILLRAGHSFGRTTAGNIAVALDVARTVENKRIVTLLYDRQDKYDTPLPK